MPYAGWGLVKFARVGTIGGISHESTKFHADIIMQHAELVCALHVAALVVDSR